MTKQEHEKAVKFVNEQIELIDISYLLDNEKISGILIEERSGFRKTLLEVKDKLGDHFCAADAIGNIEQIKVIYASVLRDLEYVKEIAPTKKRITTSKDAMTYSLEMIEAVAQKAKEKGGEIVKRTIEGPISSKVHKDKRLCIEVQLIIEYPDGSSSKITCENPVDLDYSDKTDFFVDHMFL